MILVPLVFDGLASTPLPETGIAAQVVRDDDFRCIQPRIDWACSRTAVPCTPRPTLSKDLSSSLFSIL